MMKIRIYLIFACMLFFKISTMQAQLVVSDPSMLTESLRNWQNQLEQAQKNLEAFKEQTSFLKEASDQVKKVNQAITTTRRVKQLFEQQQQIQNFLISEITSVGNNSVNYEATTSYIKRLNSLQEQLVSNYVYMSELITDDLFNLTDGERLKEINNVSIENQNLLNTAIREKSSFDSLNKKLKEINRLMEKK